MDLYYEILNYFGSAVCHQIIERSLTYKNLTLPLCARCTGIYFSFLISFIPCLIVNRKYRDFISKRYVIFGIISIILMGTGFFIEFFNLLSLTNQIRLLTGILVGNFLGLISSTAFFRISKLNLKSEEKSSSTYLFMLFLILPLIDFAIITYFPLKLSLILATLLISSEILFFSLVIYLFIQSVFTKPIINRKEISLSGKIFLSIILSISSLLISAFLRSHMSLLKIF